MPLNVPKDYSYTPTPVGPVQIPVRSSTRAKLTTTGVTFVAKENGLSGNLIRLSLIQEDDLYYFIQENTNFSSQKQIIGDASLIEVYTLNLEANESILIKRVNTILSVILVKRNTEVLLGKCIHGKLFSSDKVNFKLVREVNEQEIKLIPRVHTTLVVASETTIGESSTSVQELDIESLRASLDEDESSFVSIKKPEIIRDVSLAEKEKLTQFEPQFLTGGDGLPVSPVGMNQGPDRTLILINYGELETGEMGILNEMYEWVGSSSTQGEWKRYS